MDPRYVDYILSAFNHIYRVPDSVHISYGIENGRGICIKNNADHFFEQDSPIDASQVVWKSWEETSLPFLFEHGPGKKIFEVSDQKLVINYDLIASSFYFLSGWHEYYSDERDSYGRFPYRASIQCKLNIVRLPVVNYYFDILKEAIERHYDITVSFRPNFNSGFHLAVTHDIDNLHSGWMEESYAALRKLKPRKAIQVLLDKKKGKDIWNNLQFLAEFARRHDIKTSYYFLPTRETIGNIPHADYSLSDDELSKQIAELSQTGSEIGIHAPHGSHIDADSLQTSIRKFKGEILGGRFHYLSYELRETPEVLAKSGLAYDSTLGFSESIGFRNSFAHPFYLFDLKNRRTTSVLEIPLVVMDQSLYQKKYMDISPEEAFNSVKPVLDEVRKFGGGVAVLWHNNFFTSIKFEGWREVIEEIISYGKENNAIFCTASELAETFK